MRRLIEQHGPCPMKPKRGGFGAIASIIIGQQLSGKAADSIEAKLKRIAGVSTLTPESLKRLRDSSLRKAGLSFAKIRSIRDLIARIASGDLPVAKLGKLSDDDLHAVLEQVKGIGPWSAQMYLMFVLNRPDIFPVGDLGIRKACEKLYGIEPETEAMIALAERWRPYRTVASWYLWRGYDDKSTSTEGLLKV